MNSSSQNRSGQFPVVEQPVVVGAQHHDVVESVTASTFDCLNVAGIDRIFLPAANHATLRQSLMGCPPTSIGLDTTNRSLDALFRQLEIPTDKRTEASLCCRTRTCDNERRSAFLADNGLSSSFGSMRLCAFTGAMFRSFVLRSLCLWNDIATVGTWFQRDGFRLGARQRAKPSSCVGLPIEKPTANFARRVRNHAVYCTAPPQREVVAWTH